MPTQGGARVEGHLAMGIPVASTNEMPTTHEWYHACSAKSMCHMHQARTPAHTSAPAPWVQMFPVSQCNSNTLRKQSCEGNRRRSERAPHVRSSCSCAHCSAERREHNERQDARERQLFPLATPTL